LQKSKKHIVIAIATGLISAALIWFYASDLQTRSQLAREQALDGYGGEQVAVYVANRDVAAGETLSAANTELRTWVAELLPQGAIGDATQVYGSTINVPLLKGEPVLAAKIGMTSDPVVVPDGLCALSIAVDDVQAVGGSVTPGCAVNVYATGAVGASLVAQDVLVLDTSNKMSVANRSTSTVASSSSTLLSSSGARTSLKWVTLAVDPQQVQEILVAARDKSLNLVLPGNDSTFALDNASILALDNASNNSSSTLER
jgi:pilus assembly protein CpaB